MLWLKYFLNGVKANHIANMLDKGNTFQLGTVLWLKYFLNGVKANHIANMLDTFIIREICGVKESHHENMPIWFWPPETPLLYSKTGVYRGVHFFFISAQNIDCGYSLEPPRRGGSNEYPQSMFEQKYEKYHNFYLEIFPFLVVKFSIYLNRRVFVMGYIKFSSW